jgi:tetratricopeptide (TPR) repeat protein
VQGSSGESNLGQFPAAQANFEKAERILARLVQASPRDSALLLEYNHNANDLARAYLQNEQFPKALALARKCVSFSEAGLRLRPSDPISVDGMVASLSTLADLYTGQRDYANAIPVRERIEQLSRRLVTLRPRSAESLRTLAIACKKLGALYGVSRRLEEARAQYREAVAIDERRLAQNPATHARNSISPTTSATWVGYRGNSGNMPRQSTHTGAC